MVGELSDGDGLVEKVTVDSVKKQDIITKLVAEGKLQEVPVARPYYVGYSKVRKTSLEWFADKWYRCDETGIVWEYLHPDFPTNGFLRPLPADMLDD